MEMSISYEENKKKSLKDIWNSYCLYAKQNRKSIQEELLSKEVVKVYSKEEVERELDYFIQGELLDLQEEGSQCIEYCEEQDSYHIVSYWISGTYVIVENYIKDNYSDTLKEVLIERYPNDLSKLKEKISNVYGEDVNNRLSIEILASILLNEFQYINEWIVMYGTEEEDMIDFHKYYIDSAIDNKDDFPIIKNDDIVAAMYGINNMVHPSDLYNVFAYYADELNLKAQKSMLDEDVSIFTPDPFFVAGVESRWKNYCDLIRNKKTSKCCTDIAFKFNQLNTIEDNDERNVAILLEGINDYFYRFSKAPNSLPILNDMVKGFYMENKYEIIYSIRGVREKNTAWDIIYRQSYDVPLTAEEYETFIVSIATDFKKELNGMQKKANSKDIAYYGKYPNKESATHGLRFIKDINVKTKNKRGFKESKTPRPSFNLALAEKQSTYLIKKMFRYAKNNPILSTSFGVDSTITQHLIRRVAKHSYNLVHNNSKVEYPELYKFRDKIIKEWNLSNRITITNPNKTYWEVKNEHGFNFERKGDRRNGQSVSEICCNEIKHKPMYECIDRMIAEGNPMEVNFTGLRASESRQRTQQTLRDNVVFYAKSWKSLKVSPIAFFTDEMAWQYVDKYNVPYCDVYDKVVYYEDIFDNVSEEEYGKVFFRPRIGCWPCAIRSSSLFFLKKHYPKMYHHLMIKEGMAKELFIMGAQKQGIIGADVKLIKEKKEEITQISLFDSFNEVSNEETDIDPFKDITSEDVLNNYSIEAMEFMIMKRPCKFIV